MDGFTETDQAPYRGKILHVGETLHVEPGDSGYMIEKIETATKTLTLSKIDVTNHLLTLRQGKAVYLYRIGYGGARWIGKKPKKPKAS